MERRVLKDARALWELLLEKEASRSPVHKELLRQLNLTRIVCFREPFNMLEMSDWTMDDRFMSYIRALFDRIGSSLSLEVGQGVLSHVY